MIEYFIITCDYIGGQFLVCVDLQVVITIIYIRNVQKILCFVYWN